MRSVLILTAITAALLTLGCAEHYKPDHASLFVSARAAESGDGGYMSPFHDLQDAIDAAEPGDEIIIMPGIYKAKPQPFVEDLCGNCQDHRTRVQATCGFLIQDKPVIISGMSSDSVILETNAGYGVLFLNSWGSRISDCQITSGVRDPDGNATDAGIVIKFSKVTVRDCQILNNDHQLEDVVVGIGGIMGREGSELQISGNYIYNNGWDGIALYRGAQALITDNDIEQGRGAGIGITWDAVATVLRNRVSKYWKGIGSFGTSRATVRNNIVMDCLGWGIIATGTSFMEATNNLIYRNGNCGFANWSDKADADGARGVCSNNIIMDNGWREEWVCPCVGVWMLGKLRNLPVSYNDVDSNIAGNYKDMEDWTGKYGNISVDPMFADTITFKLSPDSPLIDVGNPDLTDRDGTRSDIGPWGGQSAGE